MSKLLAKEKQRPIIKIKKQKKPWCALVYHKNGQVLKATSIKIERFGKARCIVEFMNGETKSYPREDIVGIMSIWKGGRMGMLKRTRQ